MAIFGKLEVVKNQVNKEKFVTAFTYLEKLLDKNSIEYKRLINILLDSCVKINLDENTYVLEQSYISKERNGCFFESHKKYIDMQFILCAEEIIEVINSDLLEIQSMYNEKSDLIKYNDTLETSAIILKAGDIAILYPEDAHMPCVKVKDNTKVIKAVVKVSVD